MKNKWLISLLASTVVILGACGNEEEATPEDETVVDEVSDGDQKEEEQAVEEEFKGFDQLLDTYAQAIKEQWGPDQVQDQNIGYDTGGPPKIPEQYGYALYDIDQDGTPELLLGMHREDGYAEINELYTFNDGEAEKLFTSGIRTNIEIYQNGTIGELYGDKQFSYFQLTEEGDTELIDGYGLDDQGNGSYKRLVEPFEELSDADRQALEEKYEDIGIIDIEFQRIVQEEEEPQEEASGTLEEAEVKTIVNDSLSEIGALLVKDPINAQVEQYYTFEEVQDIAAKGLDENTQLYTDLMSLLQPSYQHLVSKEGMDAIIQTKIQLYDNPVGGGSVFFGPDPEIELAKEEKDRFEVKVIREIGPQDVGGESYNEVYTLAYEKEDGQWKLSSLKQVQ